MISEDAIMRHADKPVYEHIIETLTRCSGNRRHTAKLLGISIRGLRIKLHGYQRAGYLDKRGQQIELVSSDDPGGVSIGMAAHGVRSSLLELSLSTGSTSSSVSRARRLLDWRTSAH